MKTPILFGVLVCAAMLPTRGQDTANPKSSVPELSSLLFDADYNTRFEAGLALARLGSNAWPAVPVIGRLIETEPDKFHDVMLKVVENCPATAPLIIPALQKSLTNSNAHLRISSARTVWVLDKGQAEAVRSVARRSLVETDAGVRSEAAHLLWRMDKDPKEVVPTLAALLSDPETA